MVGGGDRDVGLNNWLNWNQYESLQSTEHKSMWFLSIKKRISIVLIWALCFWSIWYKAISYIYQKNQELYIEEQKKYLDKEISDYAKEMQLLLTDAKSDIINEMALLSKIFWHLTIPNDLDSYKWKVMIRWMMEASKVWPQIDAAIDQISLIGLDWKEIFRSYYNSWQIIIADEDNLKNMSWDVSFIKAQKLIGWDIAISKLVFEYVEWGALHKYIINASSVIENDNKKYILFIKYRFDSIHKYIEDIKDHAYTNWLCLRVDNQSERNDLISILNNWKPIYKYWCDIKETIIDDFGSKNITDQQLKKFLKVQTFMFHEHNYNVTYYLHNKDILKDYHNDKLMSIWGWVVSAFLWMCLFLWWNYMYRRSIIISMENQRQQMSIQNMSNMITNLTNHLKEKEERDIYSKRQLEEMVKIIFDVAQDAIIITDDTQIIVNVNPATEDMFWMTKANMIWKNVHDIITPNNSKPKWKPIYDLIENWIVNRWSQSWKFRSSISWKWWGKIHVDVRLNLFEQWWKQFVVWSIHDISELIDTQNRLNIRISMMEAMMEAIDTPLCFTNSEWYLLWCNNVFAKYFSKPKDELILEWENMIKIYDIVSVYWLSDVIVEMDTALMDNYRESWKINQHNILSEDVEVKIEWWSSLFLRIKRALFDEWNWSVWIVWLIMDFTDIKQSQRKQELAQRMTEDFLANMSHELRTPLNPILWYCQILLSSHLEWFTKEGIISLLQNINTAWKDLLDILGGIIDFTSYSTWQAKLDKDRFNIKRLIDSVYEEFSDSAKKAWVSITLTIKYEPELTADFQFLKKAIWKILSNSIKFISDTNHSWDIIEIIVDKNLDWNIVIIIIDNGIWIYPNEIDLIMSPFSQLERTENKTKWWVWIWLKLAKWFIQVHWWTLSIKSNGDIDDWRWKWTTVTIMLPKELIINLIS